MSINKFALSVALAGILGASSALAETSGAFVGLQGNTGFGGHTKKVEYRATGATTTSQKLKISFISLAF